MLPLPPLPPVCCSAHLGDGGAVEGVGLDDVGATLQVGGVDLLNHIGPRQHQQIVVALELIAVVLVAAAAGSRGETSRGISRGILAAAGTMAAAENLFFIGFLHSCEAANRTAVFSNDAACSAAGNTALHKLHDAVPHAQCATPTRNAAPPDRPPPLPVAPAAHRSPRKSCSSSL